MGGARRPDCPAARDKIQVAAPAGCLPTGALLAGLPTLNTPVALLLTALAVALGASSAFFSAAETAFFSLQPAQIARLKNDHPRCGGILDQLLAEPRRVLSSILLADTLANVPLCLLSLYLLRHWPGGRMEVGPPSIRFWLVALLLFLLIVFVCDLLPKVLALRNPEAVARPAAAVLGALRPVLDPLSAGLQRLGEWLADRLTPHRFAKPLQLTEDEFENIVQLGAESGAIRVTEGEMIQEIIKLGDKTAKDVMTPRLDAFALTDELSNAEAVAEIRAARRRFVPIYGETPDDIEGVLDAPRFFRAIFDAGVSLGDDAALNALPHFSELVDSPSFVPETMRAHDLLRAFLKHRRGLAIVVDEYGGIEGVVTLGDIVEEIIGDALPRGGEEDLYIEELADADATETATAAAVLGGTGPRSLLVNGNARLDDIAEHPGFESLLTTTPEGIDTIGGLIFTQLGYVPKIGTELALPSGLLLTVRQATRRRVEEVLITRRKEEEKSARETPAANPTTRRRDPHALRAPPLMTR